MPVQPPVETPAGDVQTTPAQTAPPLPGAGLNPFDQLAGFIAQNPVAVLSIVLGVLLLILLIAYFLSKGIAAHQYVRKMKEWLENPGVDAFVLALDPAINEAKLIPAKRVGSILMGLEEPAFIIPIQGGETYTFEGVGKPLVVAVKYSKFGVQWLPGLEQLVSLSVLPVAADARQSEPQDTAELLERLVKNIQTQTATISGELFIAPDLKIYVSTKTPTALNLLAREISYAASVNLSATVSSVNAISEEGERAMMMMIGAKVKMRMSLAWAIVMIAIATGVLAFLLRTAGVI